MTTSDDSGKGAKVGEENLTHNLYWNVTRPMFQCSLLS